MGRCRNRSSAPGRTATSSWTAKFAVIDYVDASLSLSPHDFGDAVREEFVIRLLVDGSASCRAYKIKQFCRTDQTCPRAWSVFGLVLRSYPVSLNPFTTLRAPPQQFNSQKSPRIPSQNGVSENI